MSKFQILCVTMGQTDFSKLEQMNIHSDVIFANQADRTEKQVLEFEGHTATMITTDTRGVGKNRNIALLYADADICLFADDDVTYVDGMEQIVMDEFEAHPDADVMIFHLASDDPARAQRKYPKTKKCGPLTRMPWGGCRIAVRLDAQRRANAWFTTLFGGGCVFPSGEDSMWLKSAKKKGLTFYVSDKSIGTVSVADSSWFTGADEKFFYGKGAFYRALYPRTQLLWRLYFAWRVKRGCNLSWGEKMKWMKYGARGYDAMLSFDSFRNQHEGR